MQLSLGPTLPCANPIPDTTSPTNALFGLEARLLMPLPTPDQDLMAQFSKFCLTFFKNQFTPLSPSTDLGDIDAWLETTHYSEKRKQQLRDIRDRMPADLTKMKQRWFACKSFVKKESMDKIKAPRIINSRSDYFKVFFGPIVKLCEQQVYQKPWFVKHVPVADRAKLVNQYLFRTGYHYFNTDHTKFEAHITPTVMNACELQFFKYMLQNFPEHYQVIERAIAGNNHCRYKWFSVDIEGERMSGDMSTSLANGLTNLCLNFFVISKSTDDWLQTPMLVEGDDGLFSLPAGVGIDTKLYSKLGFDIKLVESSSPTLGCFCGLLYDPDEGGLIKEPNKIMSNFGWTDRISTKRNVLFQLLVAKAFSLLCELPNCPIAVALALRVLQPLRNKKVTMSFSTNDFKFWDIAQNSPFLSGFNTVGRWTRCTLAVDKFLDSHPVNISLAARYLTFELFNIPPVLQIEIENQILHSPDSLALSNDRFRFPTFSSNLANEYLMDSHDILEYSLDHVTCYSRGQL